MSASAKHRAGGLCGGSSTAGQIERECIRIWLEFLAENALPLPIRFWYYQMKQDNFPLRVPPAGSPMDAAKYAYQSVVDAMTHCRDLGEIPWDHVVDESREMFVPMLSSSVTEWAIGVLPQARIDPWPGMPTPCVIAESRGVIAALRPVLDRYDVAYTALGGWCRGHLQTQVARRLDYGTEVGYFGDYNEAGHMIEGNVESLLQGEVGRLGWTRLAVTAGQTGGLPAKPDKSTTAAHLEGASYEAEALGVPELRRLLTAWLDGLRADYGLGSLDDVKAESARQRRALTEQLRRLEEEEHDD
jgi:hypothetical protein